MIDMTNERRYGTAELTLPEEVTVGTYQDFTLTYTAGFFGVDDSGSIKICFRYATDMGAPQFDNPVQDNYVEITSNAEVTLVPRFDTKDNVRPWGKTIYIKVTNGYLVEGDQVYIRFGATDGGSRGFRVQTFCEASWEFRVLADIYACYRYVIVPTGIRETAEQTGALSSTDSSKLRKNEVRLIPDIAVRWVGQAPSSVVAGSYFTLRIRAEDMWGNPTALRTDAIRFDRVDGVAGLSPEVNVDPAARVAVIEGVSVSSPGIVRFTATTCDGKDVPIPPVEVLPVGAVSGRFWADLHAQSEETIGTNSVDDYFRFARDCAWLDIASHQGNDFQITGEFWDKLQKTTKEYYEPGRFVTYPGYEWSANTGLGGDHNVYFPREGETIHRSCHALIDDLSDIDTDCNRVDELFETLKGTDAMVFAHVGGRYASLPVHDPEIRRSVEVHSAWGTFLWLLEDAFELGYRVGVVCNSDGHKGRPGASYPGASLFGSYGGLTCLFAGELTREAVWEAYRRRHHYGTTGARLLLSVGADARDDDVLLDVCDKPIEHGSQFIMGDIVRTNQKSVNLGVQIAGTAPIARAELRNGKEVIEVLKPFEPAQIGRRIRIVWEGAAFRGRGRQVDWDGGLEVTGNTLEQFEPVNFYNPDKKIVRVGPNESSSKIEWQSYTTGGVAGVILTLTEKDTGTIEFDAGPVRFSLPVNSIGESGPCDLAFTADGIGVGVRVCGLPDSRQHTDFSFEREVSLRASADNPLFVVVEQEDGHMAWSSPMYFVTTKSET